MQIELLATRIKAFIAVVEAGSITAAAEALGVGRSVVGEHLRGLEADLGTRLLARSTRRQSLTPVGEQFFMRCVSLRDLSTIALEEVSEQLATPAGILRVLAPQAVFDELVAPALAQLLKRYPLLQPEIIVDDEQVDLIEHQIDIALCVAPVKYGGYQAVRVGEVAGFFYATPAFLASQGASEASIHDVDEVASWPYVAHAWELPDASYLLHGPGGERRTITLKPAAVANTMGAVETLMWTDVGFATVPPHYVQSRVDDGELVLLLPRYAPRTTAVCAVHAYGDLAPLAVRALIDVLRAG